MIKAEKYTITGERLPAHELIGLTMNVTRSTDSAKVGLTGIIVDETQRTFTVETMHGEKIVPKNESTFTFDLNGEMVQVEGKDILYTPIERLKNMGAIRYD